MCTLQFKRCIVIPGGDVYLFHTPDQGVLYNYTNVWLTPEKTTLTFGAMASQDVHLVLSSIPGDQTTDVYEVVIGGDHNRRTFIRDGYNVGITVRGALSCSQLAIKYI